MSPVYIKTRVGKTGKRYVCYYRRGGRGFPEEYAGSFKTQKEARTRRDLIAGELAAGRDPTLVLEALRHPPAPKPGLRSAYDTFMAARIDVEKATADLYKNSREKIVPLLGANMDPATLTVADVQGAVNDLAKTLAPDSVRQYVSTLRQVLDHAEVEPNPVSSPRLRFPPRSSEEAVPPSTAEWQAVLAKIPARHRLLARLLECEGLRIGEALKLTWGDIDWVEERLRVSRARTKTRSGQRWLPVPAVLLDELDRLVPLEDRTARGRVFPIVYNTFRQVLERAVALAGVPAFSPHDLRHRRISLWFAHGVDQIQVKTWAGHARASMSADTYGHVLIDASADEWRTFWAGVYRAGSDSRAAQVRHEGGGP